MWLGGDPDDLRRTAQRLRGLGDTVAADRVLTLRHIEGMQWESTAGAAFRRRASVDLASYDHAVDELEWVARSLDSLAHALAQRQSDVSHVAAQLGRAAEDLWHEARNLGDDVLSYAGGLIGAVL